MAGKGDTVEVLEVRMLSSSLPENAVTGSRTKPLRLANSRRTGHTKEIDHVHFLPGDDTHFLSNARDGTIYMYSLLAASGSTLLTSPASNGVGGYGAVASFSNHENPLIDERRSAVTFSIDSSGMLLATPSANGIAVYNTNATSSKSSTPTKSSTLIASLEHGNLKSKPLVVEWMHGRDSQFSTALGVSDLQLGSGFADGSVCLFKTSE